MNNKTLWELYDSTLLSEKASSRQQTICSAKNSFAELVKTNPGFQADATRNGSIQPILAQRTKPNICKVSILPYDEMFIGDIVECYGEHWLVVEMYADEYGLLTGVMWLCNYELTFQNQTSDILTSYCVIDDGSYSKISEKSITTADAQYTIYLPLNSDTEKIYIDKRFAIGTTYNTYNEEILQVVKTTWVDKISQNMGQGSHILTLRVANDLYNAENDDVSTKICNYISPSTNQDDNDEDLPQDSSLISAMIIGKDTIRIGGKRTYEINIDDEHADATGNFVWSVSDPEICKITTTESTCTIEIPFNENLIGRTITLSVIDTNNVYAVNDKVIEVETIG